jgi:hypothetical protein
MSQSHPKTPVAPEGIGTDRDLPAEIRGAAGVRGDVIAWVALDPQYEPDLCRIACCMVAGPQLVMPFLWPCALLTSPVLCALAYSAQNTIKNQYWILTSTELKLINKSHEACLPGCCRTGNVTKSIPLDSITDCGVQSPSTGCCASCAGTLPSIYVDTASSGVGSDGQQQHEAIGYGLAGYSWFASEVLHRREMLKGRLAPPLNSYNIHCADVVNAIPVMDRGSTVNDSVEARIQKITKLHEDGVLTTEEYAKKRQEIIDSI